MRQVAVCKFLVVLAACLVPLLPLAASAQAVPGGGGATQATTNGGASTGTMLAAALETAGYQSQQQILQQLSTHLGMLSALVFLCVIVSAVFSFAVSGGSMRTVWLLLGPPIFMFVSGIELNGYKNRTQASGVEWAFGTFKDVNNDKDKILQPVNINTKSDVSFVFHKYNEFVSETVQMLVAVITDQDMLPQMTFMARQRVMDDLFAFDINDPHWQSLMAYFMVHCGSEVNYAMMVALGANDPVFKASAEYQTAVEQYCARWPRRDKPFVSGPWQKYAYEKNFWRHENITVQEHFQKLQEGTGVVSCAEMWSWVVAGGTEAATVKAQDALNTNMEPYAWRLESRVHAIELVLNDVNSKLTTPEINDTRNVVNSDPCPEVHQNGAKNQFVAIVNPGGQGNAGLPLGDLPKIFSHHVLRKQLTRGPAEEMIYQVSGFSGNRVSEGGNVRSNPYGKEEIVQRTKAHEFSEALRAEAYSLIMMMPYIQGILLYTLAVLYPFFMMVVLLPGQAGSVFTWMTLWAWVKSWDVGWALIMVADQILWELFPKTAFYNKANQDLYESPISMLQGVFAGDPTYNTSTYWLLLATMMSAVPVVTGHSMLGAKRVFADVFGQGLTGIVGRYAGTSAGSGGYQSYVAMENTGAVLFEREHNRIGQFYKGFLNTTKGLQEVQSEIGKNTSGAIPATGASLGATANAALATAQDASRKDAITGMLSRKENLMHSARQMPSDVRRELARSSEAGKVMDQNLQLTTGTAAAQLARGLDSNPKSPIAGHQALLLRMGGLEVDNQKTTRANISSFFNQIAANATANVDPETREAASLYGSGAAVDDYTSKLLRAQVEGAGLKSVGDTTGMFAALAYGNLGSNPGVEARSAGVRMQRLAYHYAAESLTREARYQYYGSYQSDDVRGLTSMQSATSGRHQWFLYGAAPWETASELHGLAQEFAADMENVRGQVDGGTVRQAIDAIPKGK